MNAGVGPPPLRSALGRPDDRVSNRGRRRRLLQRPIALACSAAVLWTPAVAWSQVVTRDSTARDVRALGDAVSWLRILPGNDVDTVTLYRRLGGENRRGFNVPGSVSRCCREAYGDLGRDRNGRVVQIVAESLGYLSFGGDVSSQAPFWTYDLRTGTSRSLAFPALPLGCVIERAAVWYRKTVVATNCDGEGAILLDAGTSQTSLLTIPGLNRYAYSTVELDIRRHTVAVGLAFKRCSARSADGRDCEFTTGNSDTRYDAWLLRPGCRPWLLARTDRDSRALDPPRLVGDHVYWLEGQADRAMLRSSQLRPGCRTTSELPLALGRWEQHITVAVAARRLYIARDDNGIRSRSLPKRLRPGP